MIKGDCIELYKYVMLNYKKNNNYMQIIIKVVQKQSIENQISTMNYLKCEICDDQKLVSDYIVSKNYELNDNMTYEDIYNKYIKINSINKTTLFWCNVLGYYNDVIDQRRIADEGLNNYFAEREYITFINRILKNKQYYNMGNTDNIDLNRRITKSIGSITIMCFILLNFKTINIPLFDSLIAKGGDINEPIIYPNGTQITLLDQLKTRDTNHGMISYVQTKL